MAARHERATKSKQTNDSRGLPAIQEVASFSIGSLVALTRGNLKQLMMTLAPSGVRDQLQLARDYAAGDNDLISSIVTAKTDFYAAGFGVDVAAPNPNYKGKMRERFDAVVSTGRWLGSRSIPGGPTCSIADAVSELIFDWNATDNAVLQWAVSGSKLLYVTSLAPHRVRYETGAGFERLFVTLSDAVVQRISACIADRTLAEELKAFPAKYVNAVRTGQKEVELKHADGEYWAVRTRGKVFDGLCKPTMSSVFADIVLRDLIEGGDWAVAYGLKRMIELVRCGAPIPAGYHGDPRKLYPKPSDITALKTQFQKIGDVLRVYGDHTVTIDYKFPDPKAMDANKYEKVEERIETWGAVPSVLLRGKGEGYSQGSLGARRFCANGRTARDKIGSMIVEFLTHPSMDDIIGLPAGSAVTVTWDEQNLKDPAQVLKEWTALWDRGLLDNQTALEECGYSAELIKTRKRKDQQDPEKFWWPTFEPSQGLLQQDFAPEPVAAPAPAGGKPAGKAGRPSKGAAPADASPRPGTSGE